MTGQASGAAGLAPGAISQSSSTYLEVKSVTLAEDLAEGEEVRLCCAGAVLSGSASRMPSCRRRHAGAVMQAPSCRLPDVSSDGSLSSPLSSSLCLQLGGGGRIALFPDTVSTRAQRHVSELTDIVRAGGSAAMVFLVQRGDCRAFAPCVEKDPAYARLLREAVAAGVVCLAVAVVLDPAAAAVRYLGPLPLMLDYKQPV